MVCHTKRIGAIVYQRCGFESPEGIQLSNTVRLNVHYLYILFGQHMLTFPEIPTDAPGLIPGSVLFCVDLHLALYVLFYI